MRMTPVALTSAALLLLVSCKGVPLLGLFGKEPVPEGAATTPPARVRVELQDIRFDGQQLSGRLLLTVEENSLRLDKRLLESVHLTTESVRDCGTGQALPFVVMDVLAPRPRQEDTLVLHPGYWYGKDIRVPLFTESLSQRFHPHCVDVEFSFHPSGAAPVVPLRIRAVRPPTLEGDMPLDGGMQEGPSPPQE